MYPFTGELRVKVDVKSSDQKANTPRSKHSATEQRRRSKINDRQVFFPRKEFSWLSELIRLIDAFWPLFCITSLKYLADFASI